MSISPKAIICKFTLYVLVFMLVMGFLPQTGKSQVKEHSFKITGQKEYQYKPKFERDRYLTLVISTVEYDSLKDDHLYITDSNLGKLMLGKTCYRFKGKKFNLPYFYDYLNKKELLKDGIQKVYAEDESLESELIYKEDVLQQQTFFYPDGHKQMMMTGDEKALNGAFKMWHPNGQLSFSGNYLNNQKEGLFESFDTLGNLERKGMYREGKLMEGVSVVQDFVYDTPEVPVQYLGNDSILTSILIKKTANLADVREMDSTIQRILDLKFTVDKTGKLKNVELTKSTDPLEMEIVQSVFNQPFMDFQPAQMEGVPVSSYFNKSFILTSKGLQAYILPSGVEKDSASQFICNLLEVMPEFPGGDKALWNFLAHTVKYPANAVLKKIQGKVFVQFVVMEDGSLSNIYIIKSVHPILDAEALRVVKLMPKWKPGQQDGKPVRISYTVPINFVLR